MDIRWIHLIWSSSGCPVDSKSLTNPGQSISNPLDMNLEGIGYPLEICPKSNGVHSKSIGNLPDTNVKSIRKCYEILFEIKLLSIRNHLEIHWRAIPNPFETVSTQRIPKGFPMNLEQMVDGSQIDFPIEFHCISNKVQVEFQSIAHESHMGFRSISHAFCNGFQWNSNGWPMDSSGISNGLRLVF